MPRSFKMMSLKQLQNYQQISEDFLTTNAGQDYFRWEFANTDQGSSFHRVFYFFGSAEWKLVISYTRPNNQGHHYDQLIEAAMATVLFQR